jgi:hypothetical protein
MWKRVLVVLVAACGASGSGQLGDIDARCKTLCASTVASCSTEVTNCEDECQLRVANLAPLCSTCLLENADGGTCSSGMTCCPDAHFPSTPIDCANSCTGSTGVNPSGDHPICSAICSSADPTCSAGVMTCLSECDARVKGVSGLCALCLLDGAYGGVCSSGQQCCPSHPEFPTSVTACDSVCKAN